MTEYKGFITWKKYQELAHKLDSIREMDGIYNKLDHFYRPDTDMNDKIRENFNDSKTFIVWDLNAVIKEIRKFCEDLIKLRERD